MWDREREWRYRKQVLTARRAYSFIKMLPTQSVRTHVHAIPHCLRIHTHTHTRSAISQSLKTSDGKYLGFCLRARFVLTTIGVHHKSTTKLHASDIYFNIVYTLRPTIVQYNVRIESPESGSREVHRMRKPGRSTPPVSYPA